MKSEIGFGFFGMTQVSKILLLEIVVSSIANLDCECVYFCLCLRWLVSVLDRLTKAALGSSASAIEWEWKHKIFNIGVMLTESKGLNVTPPIVRLLLNHLICVAHTHKNWLAILYRGLGVCDSSSFPYLNSWAVADWPTLLHLPVLSRNFYVDFLSSLATP